jgi:HK97 family phage portal protein
MGIIARALSFPRRSLDNPAVKFSDVNAWGGDWVNAGTAESGASVTLTSATRMSAVWRAIGVLTDGIAALPLFVMARDKGRRKATEHPLYNVLHLEPNPRHSSCVFRGLVQASVVTQGNGYAAIRRDGAGRVRELWPVRPGTVEPKVRQDGTLYYQIATEGGQREPWEARDVLHVPGLGFDGLQGMSVIGAAREGIGMGLSAQKYGGVLFARGGRVPGVLETQFPTIDKEKRKNLEEGWYAAVGGTDNYHKVALLPKGMTYKDIGITPEDGQFLETRKFQVLEIARWFNVNPHKLFDYERATFTNFEQSSLVHIVDTLLPWVVRWEQELTRKLLSPAEREDFFIAFNMSGLLRADTAARGQFYALGRQWGFFSANDVLELEDRPGIGPKGDVYLTPFNMTDSEELARVVRAVVRCLPAGAPAPALPPPADPAPAAAPPARKRATARTLTLRRRIKAAQKAVIEERARLIVNREIGAVEKEIKRMLGDDARNRRSVSTLRQAIEAFYGEHAGWAAQRMQPVIRNYADLIAAAMAEELGMDPGDSLPPDLERFVRDYSDSFGAREASEGRLQLLALTEERDEEEVAEALRGRLGEWGEKRAGKIAVNEATQFMAASAKVLYVVAGVTVLRWVANPGACPFCASMDGRTAGVKQNFVSAGQGVDGGEGTDGPLVPSDNIGHPPLHGNCECDLVAD